MDDWKLQLPRTWMDDNLKLKRKHMATRVSTDAVACVWLEAACFSTWTHNDFDYEVINRMNMDKMVEFHKRWVCRELLHESWKVHQSRRPLRGTTHHTVMSETMGCPERWSDGSVWHVSTGWYNLITKEPVIQRGAGVHQAWNRGSGPVHDWNWNQAMREGRQRHLQACQAGRDL